MARQNLAYNFDLEELKEQQSEPRRKIAHESGTKTFDRVIVARFIAIFILAGVLLAAIMYGRVELTELYSRQSQLQAELEQYENENKSLESELAQKTGLTKVENYAENELGLQKLNKSQIEYIRVKKQAVSEPVQQQDENVFMKIKKAVGDLLEYLGLK